MRVPVLPIVDFLILIASTFLLGAGILKFVYLITTARIPLDPMDLVGAATGILLLAIALVGRSWVKANDPSVLAEQRASSTLEAYEALRGEESDEDELSQTVAK